MHYHAQVCISLEICTLILLFLGKRFTLNYSPQTQTFLSLYKAHSHIPTMTQ